jgi:hypothetical protein
VSFLKKNPPSASCVNLYEDPKFVVSIKGMSLLTRVRCDWEWQVRWGLIKVTGILNKHRNKLAALVAAME